MRKLVVWVVIGSWFLFAGDLGASEPVKATITGCVTGGVLMSEKTDFGSHTSEGRYRINTLARGGLPLDLSAQEGKRISIAGQLLPGDRFYAEAASLQVLGPCTTPARKDLPRQITDDEADEIAWALPEVQGMIRRMEGSKAAPFSMITAYPDPNAEPGKPGAYYEIYVGERYDTHTVRVLTLIIDAYSGKVSVYDEAANRVVPIEEYRKKAQK